MNEVSTIIKTFPHSGRLEELARNLEAERDALREVLGTLTDICDSVPVFQLDDGKASVKAVRLAGKFTAAYRAARALLAKYGR